VTHKKAGRSRASAESPKRDERSRKPVLKRGRPESPGINGALQKTRHRALAPHEPREMGVVKKSEKGGGRKRDEGERKRPSSRDEDPPTWWTSGSLLLK